MKPLLAIALAVGLTLSPSRIPSALVGKPAPEFEVPDLFTEGVTLSTADLKDGRMKLLNIFGSWCEPCKLEHDDATLWTIGATAHSWWVVSSSVSKMAPRSPWPV